MNEHFPVLTGLNRVVEYTYAEVGEDYEGSWIVAVALRFAEAILLIEVDPDTDEAAMRLVTTVELEHWQDISRPSDVTQEPLWVDWVGASCPWRWILINQQGYTDGAQVELAQGKESVTVQWVAMASHLDIAQVRPS